MDNFFAESQPDPDPLEISGGKGKLKRFTTNTIADRKKLEAELKEIRTKGVSYDREEIDEGTGAIGVPVFDHEQRPQAALVVAGPYQRIKENGDTRIVSALKGAFSGISSSLYFNAYTGNLLEKGTTLFLTGPWKRDRGNHKTEGGMNHG